jgi:hypothetical protein
MTITDNDDYYDEIEAEEGCSRLVLLFYLMLFCGGCVFITITVIVLAIMAIIT